MQSSTFFRTQDDFLCFNFALFIILFSSPTLVYTSQKLVGYFDSYVAIVDVIQRIMFIKCNEIVLSTSQCDVITYILTAALFFKPDLSRLTFLSTSHLSFMHMI